MDERQIKLAIAIVVAVVMPFGFFLLAGVIVVAYWRDNAVRTAPVAKPANL